jgi:hypothetical protein
MNRSEARTVALDLESEVRQWPENQLNEVFDGPLELVRISRGKRYAVRIEGQTEGKDDSTRRVFISVDDGGWSSFLPVTRHFQL